MTSLKRIKSGSFNLENAVTESDVLSADNVSSLLIKPDSVLHFDKIYLDKFQSIELENGRPFTACYGDGTYSVYDYNSQFVGVGLIKENNLKIKAYIKDEK